MVLADIALKLEKVSPTFSSFNPLHSFKSRGAGYESVFLCGFFMGLTTRNQHSQKEHIEVIKELKFGVNRANIEQDTAIYINLKIYKRCMVVRTSIYFFNSKFWSF